VSEGRFVSLECHIIAGPNGAGKTTFALEYLPNEGACANFVNADLIAHGLSPFDPDRAALAAGRIMLRQIDGCVRRRESFAFESTLSGRAYAHKIKAWKRLGYSITIYYLKLPHVEMAIERVRLRVAHGGHNVPEDDIRRRFDRSWLNFEQIYRPLSDSWIVYDASGETPVVIQKSEN
jgi:predicted ABC-type ATPase